MTKNLFGIVSLAAVLIIATGCNVSDAPNPVATTNDGSAKESAASAGDEYTDSDDSRSLEGQFVDALLEHAGNYLKYDIVDNFARQAPTLCKAPSGPPPVKISNSDDDSSHGKKLYFLFAKDIVSYQKARESKSPVGQAVVKESWSAKEFVKGSSKFADHACGIPVTTVVQQDESESLATGNQTDLFIMFKTDQHLHQTDQGWVYGVVSADAKRVIQSGKIENCMGCHQDAGPDRLFGIR